MAEIGVGVTMAAVGPELRVGGTDIKNVAFLETEFTQFLYLDSVGLGRFLAEIALISSLTGQHPAH